MGWAPCTISAWPGYKGQHPWSSLSMVIFKIAITLTANDMTMALFDSDMRRQQSFFN